MSMARVLWLLTAAAALSGCGLENAAVGPGSPQPAGRSAPEKQALLLAGMEWGDSAEGTLRARAAYLRTEAAGLEREAKDADLVAAKQEETAKAYDKKARQAYQEAFRLRPTRNQSELDRMRYEAALRQRDGYEAEARRLRRLAHDLRYDAHTLRSKARQRYRQAARLDRLADQQDRQAKLKAALEAKRAQP